MTSVSGPAGTRPGHGGGFNLPVHGARGLFAAAVFVHHLLDSTIFYGLLGDRVPPGSPSIPWLQILQYGVELFFCISGFVILGAMRRAAGAGAFLLDRATRIYPVLWPSVLFMGAAGYAAGAREFGTVSASEVLLLLPANLLALPGILPVWSYHAAAWSLSYEMVFYLVCAGWLAMSRSPRLGRWAWAVLPLGAALLLAYPRAVFFLLGIAAAEGMLRRLPGLPVLARFPLPCMLVFLLAWHCSGVAMTAAPPFDMPPVARLLLAACGVLAAAACFQGIVEGRGALGRALVTRPLQWLGTVSYSLYLWHLPAIAVARRILLPTGLLQAPGPAALLLFWAMSLLLGLALAQVSYRVLEIGARTGSGRHRGGAP